MTTPAAFKKAYTNTYWVQFASGNAGCITVKSDEDPLTVAATIGGEVREIDSLPYPARPVLRRADGDACPDFCHAPRQCKGRTSCPQSYACSE